MAKYLIKEGVRGMFKIGEDNFDVIDYCRTNINWTYQADEDGVVTYKNDDKEVSVDVKKGNLVIQFYNYKGVQYPIVVIDNEQFVANLNGLREEALKRAAKEAECESCCPNCSKLAD